MTTSPPSHVIRAAVEAARPDACAKSNRGAVVFDPRSGAILGTGYNGQPEPFVCARTEVCAAACGKLCVHAEQRAIRDALMSLDAADLPTLRSFDLVHAKVINGQLVAGGGPSCWQCSREVLDVGIEAVWLYELPPAPTECQCGGVFSRVHNPSRGCPIHSRFSREEHDRVHAAWRRYSALEFHTSTLRACGIQP